MNEIDERLQEYQQLAGNDDPQSVARKEELLKWFDEHQSPELHEKGGRWMDERMKELEAGVEDIKREALRQQLSDEAYKLIPWSYIAKQYFGKSLSWLTQRVNGYTVRGHVYTLNEEQKQTLNRALSEVGTLIGSYRVV
jgi:hypothetical protein